MQSPHSSQVLSQVHTTLYRSAAMSVGRHPAFPILPVVSSKFHLKFTARKNSKKAGCSNHGFIKFF